MLNKPAGAFGLSADAEPTAEAAASPEADADAWYGYYGYGLHRPYGYGYYGYRPYGNGYGKRSADAYASEVALDAPERDKKIAKYSQIVPSEVSTMSIVL